MKNTPKQLGWRIITGESTRKQSDELFESSFNLAGEPLDEGITPEGENHVRAVAEAEARKAQEEIQWPKFGQDWR